MHHYSPSTGAFYHTDMHGDAIPADAIAISEQTHASLMSAQARGAEIVMSPTEGVIARMPGQDRETLLGLAIRRVQGHARKRILAVASLERQSNDLAAMILGAAGEPEHDQALDRRRQIDAIRAASNAIESDLNDLDPGALAVFNPSHSPRWP